MIIFFTLLFPVYCTAGNDPSQKNFFPELQGFTKKGDPVSYKPATLFEYIDGAAELYLIYDFTGLNLQVYHNQGATQTILFSILRIL